MAGRRIAWALGWIALGGSTIGADAAAQQAAQERVRYVRAGPEGARAMNLADAQAVAVLDVATGTPIAVHGERAGWLDAEVPGGFRVWVWGEFLRPTPEAGLSEVTGSDVRLRPLPSSGVESYALEQRLQRGQRVQVIEQHDPSKPASADWIRVWSPPGDRAWIRSDQTEPLGAGENGATLWAQAATRSAAERVRPAPSSGGAEGPALAPESTAALTEAGEALARERRKEATGQVPDYASVVAALEAILAAEPGGPGAELARSRLAEARALAEAYRIRVDLELERSRREQELDRRSQAMARAGERDEFFGRYEARGRLDRRSAEGGAGSTWVLHWGGREIAELVCFSGRYDLEVFLGCELGISGRVLRGPIEASAGRPPRPAQIDAARIEILAARPR